MMAKGSKSNFLAVFRADASVAMGTGHVMRCLTLADELAGRGGQVAFVGRLPPYLMDVLSSRGIPVYSLNQAPPLTPESPEPGESPFLWRDDAAYTRSTLNETGRPDWLVVDHYGLDEKWEQALRPHVGRIMVIDDLANRPHDCDLLLDQNYFRSPESRYGRWVRSSTRLLLGPGFALLRPQFREARKTLRRRDGLRRIHVFLGGSDPENQTRKVLEAYRLLNLPGVGVDVVVGAGNPYLAEVEAMAKACSAIRLHVQVENMADLMAQADLGIGAGGSASWERLAMGLPTLVISIAANQEELSRNLAETGAIQYLGTASRVSVEMVASAMKRLMDHPDELLRMSEAARRLVDPDGVVRTADVMLGGDGAADERPLCLRAAASTDMERVFVWRNALETRRYANDGSEVGWDTHVRWFTEALASPTRHLLIAEAGDEAVAVLRYDVEDEQAEVSVYLVPGFAGRGLGRRVLEAGNVWVSETLPAVRRLLATILPDNIASRKSFSAVGFQPTNHANEYVLTLHRKSEQSDGAY